MRRERATYRSERVNCWMKGEREREGATYKRSGRVSPTGVRE